MRTPRAIATENKCGGKYVYWGIESGVRKFLAGNDDFVEHSDSINLYIGIDGMRVFKSTKSNFWPILAQFDDFKPFIVALFLGESKPEPLGDYLEDFLEEMELLEEEGINYQDKNFDLTVVCFVCDAPARCYLKNIIYHAGYYSCERCKVKGTWRGRVVFNRDALGGARTDDHFTNHRYPRHQKNDESPLAAAGYLCISQFPLDYMHMICLGVVKRILQFWCTDGPRQVKLSAEHQRQVSTLLVHYRGKMPREFSRQPRPLDVLGYWKATEFRQFLLYTGPVVLRRILHREVYEHFLRLTVAISLLLETNDERRNYYLPYSRELLQVFVRDCKHVFGNKFTVYNVHSSQHIPDDVELFDCSLNQISTFPFENFLRHLRKYVRQGISPITQVGKRISEMERSIYNPPTQRTRYQMHVSTVLKDSCFLLANENYAFVVMDFQNGTFGCDILQNRSVNSLFIQPCDSKDLNIGVVENFRTKLRERVILRRADFIKKVVCLPIGDNDQHGDPVNLALIPMLHEAEVD
jgi:hypothetical protein